MPRVGMASVGRQTDLGGGGGIKRFENVINRDTSGSSQTILGRGVNALRTRNSPNGGGRWE